MKRSLNDSSARSTAGCLPVPLFNQKKRNRQPLTSNPLKNDPGVGATLESYDFPPLPTDWTWDVMNSELPPLKKTVNTGQIPHSVPYPLRSQDTVSKPILSSAESGKSGWRDGDKITDLKTWHRHDFRPQCKRINLMANDEINPSPRSLGFQQQKQSRMYEPPNLSNQKETEVLQKIQSSKVSGSTMRSLDKNNPFKEIKPNFQQNQYKKKMLSNIPEGSTVKESSSYQLQFKEKDNSLRIISAVIESMKYWREHAQKTILLFEILAVLDSAVIPGPHHSKTFIMRDGKSTLPCVFYEIDRELPRLVRGRVHRCVGNYDQKKNIFKCVSVRPASVSEQKNFQVFVKIVDAEMKYCTKVMNEM